MLFFFCLFRLYLLGKYRTCSLFFLRSKKIKNNIEQQKKFNYQTFLIFRTLYRICLHWEHWRVKFFYTRKKRHVSRTLSR